MEILLDGVQALIAEPGRIAMILIGCVLMYLGIKKEYEPTLLVPMGLGTILVNIPASGVLMTGTEPGPFQILFDAGGRDVHQDGAQAHGHEQRGLVFLFDTQVHEDAADEDHRDAPGLGDKRLHAVE